MNIMDLLSRTRGFKQQAGEVQVRLEGISARGEAGAGRVSLVITGNGTIKSIHIDDRLLSPEHSVIIQDLLIAAHEQARSKVEQKISSELSDIMRSLSSSDNGKTDL